MPQKFFQIFKGEEDGTGKDKGRETPAVGLGEPFILRETKDWCNSIKDPSALGLRPWEELFKLAAWNPDYLQFGVVDDAGFFLWPAGKPD